MIFSDGLSITPRSLLTFKIAGDKNKKNPGGNYVIDNESILIDCSTLFKKKTKAIIVLDVEQKKKQICFQIIYFQVFNIGMFNIKMFYIEVLTPFLTPYIQFPSLNYQLLISTRQIFRFDV